MSILPLVLALALQPAPTYRESFPLPGLRVPDGWGVNIHFTDPTRNETEMIAEGGFRWVRMDFFWHQIEKEKGVYDFSAYDRLMVNLRRNALRPLFILDYGNDLYQKGSPSTPEAREAFAKFVRASVQHFRRMGVLWEMWNEPNIHFWQPKPNVQDYVALATEVGKTIRQHAPDEWYVGPAMSGFDWSFLESCFKAGMLRYWDAVTIHPYRGNHPETVGGDWHRMERMVAKYAPAGKRLPLLSGEWGYSELYSGLSKELQAQYIVRQYLTNLQHGIGISIWYDWKNDGTDPKETEHFFGTIDHDLNPKPAYRAVQNAVGALRNSRYVGSFRLGTTDNRALLFQGEGQSTLAVWTPGATNSATMPTGGRLQVDGTPKFLPLVPDSDWVKKAVRWRNVGTWQTVSEATSGQVLKSLAPADGKLLIYDTPNGRTTGVQPVSIPDVRKADWTSVALALPRLMLRGPEPRVWTLVWRTAGQPDLVRDWQVAIEHPIRASIVPSGPGSAAIQLERDAAGPLRGVVEWTSPKGPVRTPFTLVGRPVVLKAPEDARLVSGAKLLDQKGRQVAQVPGLRTSAFEVLPVATAEAAKGPNEATITADGDPKVGLQMSASMVRVPPGAPHGFDRALSVKVKFESGWKFVTMQVPRGVARTLVGKPRAMGVWVHSDRSGDMFRIRYVDSRDQSHQVDGPRLDWKGWKFVEIPLFPPNVSWGGPADNVVHWPIRLDVPVLVDSTGRDGKSHETLFAGFSVLR